MDTKVLKDKFGKEISFWGAIDTTQVLPNGSIDVVKREVQKEFKSLDLMVIFSLLYTIFNRMFHQKTLSLCILKPKTFRLANKILF